MTGVSGKVVAIAGASSGIGEATAVHLAERGARLVLGARRVERLETLVERIRETGGEAVAVRTDVRERGDMERLVTTARERFGRLDVLFSNAGSMAVSPLDDLRVDDWDLMVDVNLKGVLNGIAAALPVFRAQGSGHFVHTASTAAYRVVPEQAVYAATKTAVKVLTEGLRQEAGPKLRVTLVSPGFTNTEGVGKGGSPETAAALIARRDEIAMPPDAIARAVAFAIEQPDTVDVGEIVVRPTAQG
ncbi:SDR family oxidoreductase [Actinacidiphila acididurans]|uniref:SDR family oxidoreductase n=1 Tax=Actinacidiphila acididurans TaxID=2784346 RepID=A0ABS2TS95_9ACTN|nr:SDR family oxidoreductase [Actinacidiphila acididurans]MBM9506194.1 SDR family oxidoreductase [Actinacidiphila acididurans]